MGASGRLQAADSATSLRFDYAKVPGRVIDVQVKFNLWLKRDGFKGKVLNGAVREPEQLPRSGSRVCGSL